MHRENEWLQTLLGFYKVIFGHRVNLTDACKLGSELHISPVEVYRGEIWHELITEVWAS